LNEKSEYRAQKDSGNAHGQELAVNSFHQGALAYGGKTILHYLEAKKYEAGAKQEVSKVDQSPFPPEKLENYAQKYGWQCEIRYFKSNKLYNEGCAYAGSEKDGQGLIEGNKSGIHKAYYQNGGGAAGLEQRGEAAPHKGSRETIAGGFFKKSS
jgi:hypothetical protein